MTDKSYLRRLRVRWMLSQGEIAEILDIDQGRISRYEKGEEAPSLAAALGYQVIFGCTPKSSFGVIYAAVEDAVMRRAARFERNLRGKGDPASVKKRHLLNAMVERATNHTVA